MFVKDRDQDPFVSPSGYPTGLIYGCLSMLSDWIQDVSNPSRLDVFMDGSPSRRLAFDPDYKKRRDGSVRPWLEPRPLRLLDGFSASCELDVLTHVLGLLGADVYHGPGEEADDLIASYVASRPEDIHVIVSSDRDFYQLLAETDRVILYRPGTPGNRFFDAERAEEDMLRKHSVRIPPGSVRMFKALTGDSSDGIPGVPRLRKKVAAPLCSCRSVDELFATGLPGFSKAERERAEAMRGRIAVNHALIGLYRDIDVSALRRASSQDLDLAARILRDDLGILSVPVHVFRFGPGRARYGDSYSLLPDFLRDI